MAYELFERTGVRVEDPVVSVTPEGRVTFNAAAVRILANSGVKHVALLWDRAGLKMAAKAVARSDRNGYAVSFTDKHSASLRAKAFFQHIGWSASRRETLAAIWNEKERMFEIELPSQHLRDFAEAPGIPVKRPSKHVRRENNA